MSLELPVWTIGAFATIGGIPIDYMTNGGFVNWEYYGLYYIPFVWAVVGGISLFGFIYNRGKNREERK